MKRIEIGRAASRFHPVRAAGAVLVGGMALWLAGCSQKSEPVSPASAPGPAAKSGQTATTAPAKGPAGPAAKGPAGKGPGPGATSKMPMGMPMMGGGGGMPQGDSTDSPIVGKTAPDFTLPNDDGKQVNLKKLLAKGPVLIYFYKGMW
ncbi:MAG: redoxin domain-containing protein [Armatimonadetes bacterium]|nr:redoxin domain-containing protein [Armatimonadota bacterium]